jgi:NTE family protein
MRQDHPSRALNDAAAGAEKAVAGGLSDLGQIVLVLQGGGALGAYQAGVYEALHEAGVEPDWVIGTSIGAINASLIAGNKPERRLARLRAFWRRIEQDPALEAIGRMPFFGASLTNWVTFTSGVANFFKPNPQAFLGQNIPLAADAAGYYSTQPLEATLNELVDFSLVEDAPPHCRRGQCANRRNALFRQP